MRFLIRFAILKNRESNFLSLSPAWTVCVAQIKHFKHSGDYKLSSLLESRSMFPGHWVCNVREEACSKSGGKTPAPSSIKKNIWQERACVTCTIYSQFHFHFQSLSKGEGVGCPIFDIFSQLLVSKDLHMPNCKACPALSQTLSPHTIFKQLAS
jgi:hypothetical protein